MVRSQWALHPSKLHYRPEHATHDDDDDDGGDRDDDGEGCKSFLQRCRSRPLHRRNEIHVRVLERSSRVQKT